MRRLLLLLLVAGCSGPPQMSDWEREHALKQAPRDDNVAPPPFPSRGKLIEFPVAESGGIRFFVDGSTLSVDADGVVRYVLVAQSAGGAQNVTFEGLRCAAATHRLYATGHSDRTWTPARSAWQPLRGAQRWQLTLYREYFCPQKIPIRSADEGLRALQSGGHPFAKGLNAPDR